MKASFALLKQFPFRVDIKKIFYNHFFKSVLYHVLLVLILSVAGFWKPLVTGVDPTLSRNIKLVQSSVRVDVVAMPKLTVKELKKIEATGGKSLKTPSISSSTPLPEPEAVIEPEKNAVEFKKAEEKKSLDEILKELSEKKVKKKAKRPSSKKKSQVDQKGDDEVSGAPGMGNELKSLVMEGNKLAKGTSLVGKTRQGDTTLFDQYAEQLPDFVRPHWKLPSYLLQKNLQCRIQVFISKEGDLIKQRIFQSSGEKEYDQKALNAVKHASPFPKPAEEIVNRLVRGDIVLGFPL